MRTYIAVCVATLFTSVAPALAFPLPTQEVKHQADAPKSETPKVNLRLDQLVPKNWKTVEVETHSWPTGTERPEEGAGLAITFQGPPVTPPVVRKNPGRERLTIWIMPEGFQPPSTPWRGQAIPAFRLGLTGSRGFVSSAKGHQSPPVERGKRYLIYVKPWTDIASWPGWEKDIRDYFGIEQPGKTE